MIRRGDERELSDWLRLSAPPAPVDLEQAIRRVVVTTPQRSAWRARLQTRGTVAPPRLAMPAVPQLAVLILLALLAAALAFAIVGGLLRQAPARNGLLLHTLQEPGYGAFTIYIRDAEGEHPRVIGHGDCPTFVADNRVLWTGDSEATAQTVFLAGIDGSDVRELPHLAGTHALSVSPDGRDVAWLREVDTYIEPNTETRTPIVELWVSSLDQASGRQLDDGAPGTIAPYVAPAWSPDGRSIAYATTDHPRTAGAALAPRQTVRVAQARGSKVRVLTERRGQPFGSLTWSPDSRLVAFDGEIAGAKGNAVGDVTPTEIYTADVVTGEERKVTSAGNAFRPTWSPDGRLLAYAGMGGGLHVVRLNAAGEALEPARSDPAERTFGWIGWSPDGKWLVGAVSNGESGEGGPLLLIDPSLDGSERQLATGPVTCQPSWQRLTP